MGKDSTFAVFVEFGIFPPLEAWKRHAPNQRPLRSGFWEEAQAVTHTTKGDWSFFFGYVGDQHTLLTYTYVPNQLKYKME